MKDALVPATPPRAMPPWALAAASYLARYSGNTLATYTTSLRLLFRWCEAHDLDPLAAQRVHLELFTRYLEQERGCIPRSVAHHLTPVFGYYRFAQIDGYTAQNPTALLRRPRVYIDQSRQLALDRDELRRLLDAARASSPTELALITLMALLGLRVSEAIGALVEDLGTVVRGHPTLKIVGKGGKPATIPLPRPVAEILDAAVGERTHGRIVLRTPRGGTEAVPWTRRAAALALRRLCRAAGIDKRISPHSLRHTFVTLGLDAGIPLRTCRSRPGTPTRGSRRGTTEVATTSITTRTTGSRRNCSRGEPGRPRLSPTEFSCSTPACSSSTALPSCALAPVLGIHEDADPLPARREDR